MPDWPTAFRSTTVTRVAGRGYIDEVTLAWDPRTRGVRLAVMREYQRVSERLDFAARMPGWVQLRTALQGGAEL